MRSLLNVIRNNTHLTFIQKKLLKQYISVKHDIMSLDPWAVVSGLFFLKAYNIL